MSCKQGDILLSILIASLPERVESLGRLYDQLVPQTLGEPVEILVHTDNRVTALGNKRQHLNESAKGKYVVHVDDDDSISSDYVSALLERIRMDRFDVINFICMVYLDDDKNPKPCYYSKDFTYLNLPAYMLRKPNSRCCFRREVALRRSYSDIPFCEDDDWGEGIHKEIRTESIIDRVLYHYKWKEKGSAWFTTWKERNLKQTGTL